MVLLYMDEKKGKDMAIEDQLDADILSFFENVEKQTLDAKAKTLKLLIDKYAHLISAPILLDKYDFEMIKEHANRFYATETFPKKLGENRREISSYEANVLSIIEGTIMVLNNNDCLKKLPKFDYRD